MIRLQSYPRYAGVSHVCTEYGATGSTCTPLLKDSMHTSRDSNAVLVLEYLQLVQLITCTRVCTNYW